jgi:streptogramin lyase
VLAVGPDAVVVDAAGEVHATSDRLEVVRVDASAHSAEVIEVKTGRDRSAEIVPGPQVRHLQ